MKFDVSEFSEDDLNDLNEAIKRTGPKVRYWYKLDNFHYWFFNEQKLVEQTKAISDYNKLSKEYEFMTKDEYNFISFHLSDERKRSKGWRGFVGFKDLEFCVYNPENPLIYLGVENKKAELIQVDSLGLGNTYEGRINFEKGYAVLEERDQDLAHKLGLMFSPAGILESDSLSPSDTEIHKNKNRLENNIYCDNRCCQKKIRNPLLVVDDKTGGVYHSPVCYHKDIKIKKYLGVEGCSPREIYLSEAKEMLRNGSLQQSQNYKGDFVKLRNLDPWPEAAIVLRP